MTLICAATFTKALDRLTAAEQKQVKITAFDLAQDESGNGHQLHRVISSPGFWTARVSQDVRIVLHKEGANTLLAWVGHHDDAYDWAERRRMVPHERTGAMQLVEVVERIEERLVYTEVPYAEAPPPVAVHRPFASLTEDDLLNVGVPREWLEVVRTIDEASVDGLFASLPGEAAEALWDFATGGSLEDHVATRALPGADPYAHPDAQRRFRIVEGLEELKAALDAPFAQWAVFLHPTQRVLVERDWRGPARVSGSAGTGKTIVALHRAIEVAKRVDAEVLLTTFSKPLAAELNKKCAFLAEAHPGTGDRITISTIDQQVYGLYAERFGQPDLATNAHVRSHIAAAMKAGLGGALSAEFLQEEWEELVDAWNVIDPESYAKIPRLGRRTRLGPAQREAAWAVFDFVRQRLDAQKRTTWSAIYARLAGVMGDGGSFPYTHVIVDEAQDLSVAQVRFLAALQTLGPDALFFAGDRGQRIFHMPFSWAKLGLDLRGRSHCLKINYRTSHQIRATADRLLPATITDMDGIEEGRRGTISVFDGPAPDVAVFQTEGEERDRVAQFLIACLKEGMEQSEISIIVRGRSQVERARAALAAAKFAVKDANPSNISTMHDAKGLEFRAVAVMACDEDVLPDPVRLSQIGDAGELEAAYETERHLLYVACTRARDRLLVTGVSPGSEFLEDLA